MYVYFECENGHRLKARVDQSGRGSKCPKCHAEIVVPERANHSVTDSSVVRLLTAGDLEGASKKTKRESATPSEARPSAVPAQAANKPTVISCPRCSANVPATARSCDECGLYITVNAGAWSSVLQTAARYVRQKRGA